VSAPVLLPLSRLRAYRLRGLKRRIAHFQQKHNRLPDEQSTFADWVDASPLLGDPILELCCIAQGERVAAALAIRAAKRALPIYEGRYPGDSRPREAIDLAEMRLAGENVSRDRLRAAHEAANDAAAEAGEESDDEPAAFDNVDATPEESEEFLLIVAAADAARAAAHAASDVAICAHAEKATQAARDAFAAYSGTDRETVYREGEIQRADLMELLGAP